MSAARLYYEAQAAVASLLDAAVIADELNMPAQAQRLRLAADLIDRLAQRLPIFTLRTPL
jgi:hypothetical protein